MNLPATWDKMGFIARAAYLCQTHQAKDFRDACSILKQRRRLKTDTVPSGEIKIRYPYAEN